MTFGERLATKRKEKKKTMAAMAAVIGMTTPGYKRLEDGTGGKTFEKLAPLAKALGCRIDDLFPEMDAQPEETNVSEGKSVCADGFEGARTDEGPGEAPNEDEQDGWEW